jgi:hypothetical protein
VTTPGIEFHGVVMLARRSGEIRGASERFAQPVADIVQSGLVVRNPLLLKGLNDAAEATICNLLILCNLWGWLAALDDFRNWLALGFQPEKLHENP